MRQIKIIYVLHMLEVAQSRGTSKELVILIYDHLNLILT